MTVNTRSKTKPALAPAPAQTTPPRTPAPEAEAGWNKVTSKAQKKKVVKSTEVPVKKTATKRVPAGRTVEVTRTPKAKPVAQDAPPVRKANRPVPPPPAGRLNFVLAAKKGLSLRTPVDTSDQEEENVTAAFAASLEGSEPETETALSPRERERQVGLLVDTVAPILCAPSEEEGQTQEQLLDAILIHEENVRVAKNELMLAHPDVASQVREILELDEGEPDPVEVIHQAALLRLAEVLRQKRAQRTGTARAPSSIPATDEATEPAPIDLRSDSEPDAPSQTLLSDRSKARRRDVRRQKRLRARAARRAARAEEQAHRAAEHKLLDDAATEAAEARAATASQPVGQKRKATASPAPSESDTSSDSTSSSSSDSDGTSTSTSDASTSTSEDSSSSDSGSGLESDSDGPSRRRRCRTLSPVQKAARHARQKERRKEKRKERALEKRAEIKLARENSKKSKRAREFSPGHQARKLLRNLTKEQRIAAANIPAIKAAVTSQTE